MYLDLKNRLDIISQAVLANAPMDTPVLETIHSLEDFKTLEERLENTESFNALVRIAQHHKNTALLRQLCLSHRFKITHLKQVQQLSRIGGRDTRDCTHKVLDRYVS